jgi:hypothetical protein
MNLNQFFTIKVGITNNGVRSTSEWEERDAMSSTMVDYSLDNNVMLHV